MTQTINPDRCQRCREIPKGKLKKSEAAKYRPYCSFHCQEWGKLKAVRDRLNQLREAGTQ